MMIRFHGRLGNMLADEHTEKRFLAIFLVFFSTFYSMTILSQLFLPEGILRGKTSGNFFETSSNIWLSSLQIFSWNMLSVVVLFVANLFAYRKNEADQYVSYGILSMIVWATIDGVVLGTNSFGIQRENMEIMNKILSTFDLRNRAGMWELVGLNCIASALQQKAIVFTTKKTTVTKKILDIKFSRWDIIFFALGLILMIIGAYIESSSIIHIK